MKLRAVVGSAVGGWLAWRMLGPELQPRYQGGQLHPMPVPGRTVFVGRREYFVREAGPTNGPPLVLIHGWIYESVLTWHRLVPYLADRYRLIMIDQRNYGGSTPVHEDYEVEDVADEIADVMEVLGLEKAAVFGYSMGGMVALALARRHPGHVERLILGGTAAWPVRNRFVALAVAFVVRAAWRLGRVDGARLSYWYLLGLGATDRRYSRWLWSTLMSRDPDLNYRAGAAIARFDARPWVHEVQAPTLVIIPTRDQVIPTSFQYEMAHDLPDCRVVELLGARHEAALTHAREVAEAIIQYLDKDL